MNYYNEIKNELINNEVYKKVKDYSKNRSDLTTYYNVGKMLNDAGKHYGESIMKEYSIKLTNELGKKYSERTLQLMKKFYLFQKTKPLVSDLTWSHYLILLPIKDENKINYYINEIIKRNLSKRELQNIIKNNEYERLPESTKNKLVKNQKTKVENFIKNPIIINTNKKIINEKILHQVILENIEDFLEELGSGYSFIKSEYKIKINNTYNYIDLLLFNIKFNCYVVIELKTTELKKEHIGQIEVYMNYINKNIKTINQNDTIGIIISREDNKYLIKYCSDSRIFNTKYITI